MDISELAQFARLLPFLKDDPEFKAFVQTLKTLASDVDPIFRAALRYVTDCSVDETLHAIKRFEVEGGMTKDQAICLRTLSMRNMEDSFRSTMRKSVTATKGA